ncbi:MAG: hypothetical protein HRU20_21195 [Pseudomonadales bacterium]|nr:hypothetical protein [Pseudomonadales bacterium]
MMQNPGLTPERAGRQIGYGPSLTIRIMQQAKFKDEYTRRRKEFEVFMMRTQSAQISHLATTALTRMQDHLDAQDGSGNDIA